MNDYLLTPQIFHQDFENNLPKEGAVSNKSFANCIRVVNIALPFISLYQPIGRTLALASSSLRLVTSIHALTNSNELINKELLGVVLSVASIAGTVFMHPVGMTITTLHDIYLNLHQANDARKKKQKFEMLKQISLVAHNALYLVAMTSCSLQLRVILLALQMSTSVVNGIFSCVEGLGTNRSPEAIAKLLFSFIRAYQLSSECQKLEKLLNMENALKRIFVGELGEKWQFPSNHLPVGAKVDEDRLKVVSWNILNNADVDATLKSQGLSDSMISKMNIQITKSDFPDAPENVKLEAGLTKRDMFIVFLLHKHLFFSSKNVIALQGCGEPFLKFLESMLPHYQNWNIIRTCENPTQNQEVVLYHTPSLTPLESDPLSLKYESLSDKQIQNVTFQTTDLLNQKIVRIFNTEIPKDNLDALNEFAVQFKNHTVDGINLAVGSFAERNETVKSLNDAGLVDYKLHTPWQTTIDPETKESIAVDHILVKGAPSKSMKDYLVMSPYLSSAINLLKGKEGYFFGDTAS